MKGTVVNTWINTMEKMFDRETVNTAKEKSSWNEELIITPLMNIDDEKAFDLIETVAEETGKTPAELWQDIGRQNIKSFHEWFPSYFRGRELKDFLMMMDTVHQQLTRMIPGANPPGLKAREIDNKTLEIIYSSPRGMFNYFLGLLEGSSEFFQEPVNIEEINKKEENGIKYLKVYIHFENSFKTTDNYFFSKILSFGIFNKIKYKLGFNVFLITFISGLILSGELGWQLPLLSVISGSVTVIFSHFLIKPLDSVKTEMDKAQNLNFNDIRDISTGDEIENIFNKLKKIEQEVKKDILFLKGGTDDMYNFVAEFMNLADDMNKVSNNISTVVQEVANGAEEQAEETENSAYIVDENVEQIKDLAEAGNQSKDNLEEAVDQIQQSAREVKEVNNRIEEVRNSFADINQRGINLSRQINEIKDIVNQVAEIADQTNLLSLNASIEAARSRENSQGFTVVAEEIRELAEDSRKAGETINENLEDFTGKVEELVQNISSQFSNLEQSNQALEQVTSSNLKSSKNINQTAGQVVTIVEKLNSETQKISQVIENLNSLAAIAEENSASSQEMSASVSDYSDKIKNMMGYVEQMQELVDNFKDNLNNYNA
ncbi:MAG: heme NO-binding domain-containing protein [Halanaerobiales bacterium]